MEKSYRAFREKLNQEHHWPCIYMFKFIVPKEKSSEILEMFPESEIKTKESKEGKYVSFTINQMIDSSDEVIKIYEEAHKIEGVIAL